MAITLNNLEPVAEPPQQAIKDWYADVAGLEPVEDGAEQALEAEVHIMEPPVSMAHGEARRTMLLERVMSVNNIPPGAKIMASSMRTVWRDEFGRFGRSSEPGTRGMIYVKCTVAPAIPRTRVEVNFNVD